MSYSGYLIPSAGFEPNAGQPPVSSTDKPCSPMVDSSGKVLFEFLPPRRLNSDEIPALANDFRIAARNAMEAGKSRRVYPNSFPFSARTKKSNIVLDIQDLMGSKSMRLMAV